MVTLIAIGEISCWRCRIKTYR